MISYEKISKTDIKESMKQIEETFKNQAAFNAMDEYAKVEMIKDYMYLQGVNILGGKNHDVRLYGGIKTNNYMQSIAYSMVEYVKDGGECLKELQDPLWHKLAFPTYDIVIQTDDMKDLGKVNINDYVDGLKAGKVKEMREAREQGIVEKRATEERIRVQAEQAKKEREEKEERDRIEKENREKQELEEKKKREAEEFENWKIEHEKQEAEREREQKAFEEKMKLQKEENDRILRMQEEQEKEAKEKKILEEQNAKELAEKEAKEKLLREQEEKNKPVEEKKPYEESEYAKAARLEKEAKEKEFQAEKDQAAKDVKVYGDKIATNEMGNDDFEKRQTIYKYLTALCKTDDRFTLDNKANLESSIRTSTRLFDGVNTLLDVKKGQDLLDELTNNKYIIGECKKGTLLNSAEKKQIPGYQDFTKDLFGRMLKHTGTVTKNVNDANEAKVGVHLGSKEYDKAVASMDILKEAYTKLLDGNCRLDRDEKRDLERKIQTAENDIEKYYQRKIDRKELTEAGEFTKKTDAKSKKRINVMKNSMDTLSKIRAELGLPEREIAVKKDVDPVNKTSFNEMMMKTGTNKTVTTHKTVSRTNTKTIDNPITMV